MNIGTEKETVVIEPVEEPIPNRIPEESPREPQPVR